MNGLVLSGGQSSRMGQPKCLLDYHGVPQYRHVADMLSPFCEQVFISCLAAQKPWFEPRKCLLDQSKYGEIGPMNGLLSAFDYDPASSWMVLGCDYPLLEMTDLLQLLTQRDPDRPATLFGSTDGSGIEPLLGIYEPAAGAFLREAWQAGQYSLRRMLPACGAKTVIAQHPEHLKSVDTAGDYEQVTKYLSMR
jgi:molybdopterin-guanine dinucleotide biosynthesis protein A